MPREIKVKSIRNELPATYRYSPWMRLIMLFVALAICIYAIFFFVKFVTGTTPMFFKVLPLIILFVALDSVFKQLTSLYSVTFYEDRICFGFLGKPKLIIPYENITSIDLTKQISFSIILKYKDKDREKIFKTSASFPKILEILLNLADFAPQAQLNDLLGKVVNNLRNLVGKSETEQV
ncbi:YdbT family protein [Candidatus Cloacimonas acidaminovorans]|jgi:hypothetical protein|uniref:hypothetical protein n=1 Tax=Candidatus Cloacimonas acidaminovorans TaxID=456827 RepID=UPI0002D681B2|nr:hypothetical protein [Candidatus Cloacimonas acidaminovorans]